MQGDVAIIDCTELSPAEFAAQEHRHRIPADVQQAFRDKYKHIFAWHLAAPRRYESPVPFTRRDGQVVFIDLEQEPSVMQALASVSSMSTTTSVANSNPDVSGVAAAAADKRQATADARGIGDADLAANMAKASARAAK